MIVPFKFSVSGSATVSKDPFSTSDNEMLTTEITKARLEIVNFAAGGFQCRLRGLSVTTDKAATVTFGVRNVAGSGFDPVWATSACNVDGGGIVRVFDGGLLFPLNLDSAGTYQDDFLVHVVAGTNDCVVTGDLEFYK